LLVTIANPLMKRQFPFLVFCILIAAVATAALLAGCSRSKPPEENPEWIKRLIVQYEAEPAGNPPRSIWRYKYRGRTVYYVAAQSGDQYSALLDSTGTLLGAPDGGIDGVGDGRCPDFLQVKTSGELIWKDPRSAGEAGKP
jgi:Domain of unknown function (DUF6970)